MASPFDPVANSLSKDDELRTVERFVDAVETIRRNRVIEARYSVDANQKTFRIEEIIDQCYPAYNHLRNRHLRRVPPRSTVMQIAEYLECDLSEVNKLLRAAGYGEVRPYPTVEELEPILAVAREMIEYLPLPSLIITRDWNIHGLNRHILTLFGLTEDVIKIVPAQKLNILHMIFDPELPIRTVLGASSEVWHNAAVRNISGFKAENIWCENDPWYQRLVNDLMELPDFANYWKSVPAATELAADFGMYVTEVQTGGQRLRVRTLLTMLGDQMYPQIASYVPADPESRKAFTSLHLPTPENQWLT